MKHKIIKKHNKFLTNPHPKSRKEMMHEMTPLNSEVQNAVEKEELNEKEYEKSDKPTKLPKKIRSHPGESYFRYHRH